jgi:hypothetical protein
MNNNKSLNGLVDIQADTIESNYYNGVPSSKILYLSNVTSDIQEQINSISYGISGEYINNTYLQNQINSLSGSVYYNYNYVYSVSGRLNNYIISNNLYNISLSGRINNNFNNQNLINISLSSLIYSNNFNSNLYNISLSGRINNNFNNQNLINISLSSLLNNYIISNNNYVYSLSGNFLYYNNQCQTYAANALIYQNNALTYQNNAGSYSNSARIYSEQSKIDSDNSAISSNSSASSSNSSKGYRDQAKGYSEDAQEDSNNSAISAAASAASAVVSGASAVASAGSATSSAASAAQATAIVTTFNTTYGPRIEAVEAKTEFQTISLGMTNFSTGVEIGSSPISVSLNPTTPSNFYNGINCESSSIFQSNITTNGISNSNGISNTGGISSDSISIDSGRLSLITNTTDQICYKSSTVRDCAIEFTSNLNPAFLTDTGTINLRGFNINIGNANQSSVIYLNGTVYFYNPISMSSFFNQFP